MNKEFRKQYIEKHKFFESKALLAKDIGEYKKEFKYYNLYDVISGNSDKGEGGSSGSTCGNVTSENIINIYGDEIESGNYTLVYEDKKGNALDNMLYIAKITI